MSDRFIPLPEVQSLTSLSRSAIYERIKAKLFPTPINLGGRRVAWLESEISAWIAARIDHRHGGA